MRSEWIKNIQIGVLTACESDNNVRLILLSIMGVSKSKDEVFFLTLEKLTLNVPDMRLYADQEIILALTSSLYSVKNS